MEHCEQSEAYAKIGAELIRSVPSLRWIQESEISVGYLASDYKKTSDGKLVFGECRKVPAWAAPFIPYDFLITVYDVNCMLCTPEQLRILLHHELLHIDMSEKGATPVCRTKGHDVEDFREIIEQYGLDWSQ